MADNYGFVIARERVRESLQKVLFFFGFDRAVGYGVLTRVWGLIAGPISMIMIAEWFTKEQQGFYYTFSSLLALQIFFELGLLFVVAQFASHEFVHLTWGKAGRIEGSALALGRFIDLLSKTVKWFGVASLIMVVGLAPAGLFFFGQGQGDSANFAWRFPWVLAVAGTALNLLVTPFFAVIMGSGDVVTVNHRELIGGIAGSCLAWLVMGMHGGLYAVFAVTFGNVIISWSYLFRQKPELLRLAWHGLFGPERNAEGEGRLSWRHEIWPMQWRMAVSSGSAYFIFQLFNPVLFHFHGPIVAGQMGMTLTAANALLGISATLVTVKSPEFGKLIALRDWKNLDSQFYKVLWQSIVLVTIGAILGWGVIWFLQQNYAIGERFIPASYAALLLGTVCIQVINSAFAVYLRAHKQEPLMVMTIVASILQGAATWYFGMHYSTLGVTAAYFAITLFFIFPCFYIVWKRCRINWHTA